MAKVFKGFRFDPQLYEKFVQISSKSGSNATGAFEKFMVSCVEAGELVFADPKVEAAEAEARVMVDWLKKGKRFYRGDSGKEVNIPGRLVGLLPRIHDAPLRGEVEAELKKSAAASG